MNSPDMPVIVLGGLEGNAPTHLKGLQVLLAPYVPQLIDFWTVVFCITVALVSAHGLFLPLARKLRGRWRNP